MLDIHPFADFGEAADAVLHYLKERFGFGLWMVTRTEGDDWIVLESEATSYSVKPGDVFRWQDSFCSHMVAGRGPRVAPCSGEVPCYATAAIGRAIPIGAYIGVPLTREDGALFGTLCAIDPIPQPASLVTEQPLFELFARLLSTQLAVDMRLVAEARKAERAQNEAMTDALTGLYNRRGWLELSAAEEHRCQRLGNPACVLSIDLDDLKRVNDTMGHAAGDALILRAARAISQATRKQDIAARLGGDEFIVLGVDCDREGAGTLYARVQDAFADAGVNASVGMAVRDPRYGLAQAVEEADLAMYQIKAGRRAASPRGGLK